MNRTSIAVLVALSVGAGLAACSQANPTPISQGIAGSGNAPSGSAGASGSSAGASPAGGAATVAGSGGDVSTGGSLPGAGDTGAGGSTAGAATGGAATGGSGGGTAGGNTAGGSAAGGGGITPEAIVPTLDGLLWVGDCADATGNGKDCPILNTTGTTCVTSSNFYAEGAFKVQQHKVGGTAGTKYLLNLEFRGVTGGKNYNGGTRQSTSTTISQTANDGWYVGGLPTATKWNTYEIHVTPPVPGVAVNNQALTCPNCPTPPDNVYYTNSILGNADGTHETFPIKINASFPVLGGGTITLIIHDSNCLGQQNCGSSTDPNAMCTDPRTIDLSGMAPAPPASFAQPFKQTHTPNPWYPQWLFVDVKSVTQP
ncbi:MAG: hypothetical protein ABUL62_24855 [Myxococcales bacterium]